jgi:xanthine dehydrogenase accessory factor
VRDVMGRVNRWGAEGKAAAIATVVRVEGSAPSPPGTVMVMAEDGDIVGSVSGGCVEPAVYQEALDVIRTGIPKFLAYGISDDESLGVGLTCGGTIEVFVERVRGTEEWFRVLHRSIVDGLPVAVATQVRGPNPGARMVVSEDGTEGTLGDPGLDRAVVTDVVGMLDLGSTATRTYGVSGERRPEDIEVFICSFSPPPRMYVFGAVDFAAATARIGKYLGYRVTVCDPRATFATPARFPEADEVVVLWPDEFLATAHVDRRTVVCVLTHDPRFDVPLLKVALTTPAGYIGAMGSRRMHVERCERLVDEGITREQIARISGPIGLDIGARTPEEVAVAIAAEIIQLRTGASGSRLVDTAGPIHGGVSATHRVG